MDIDPIQTQINEYRINNSDKINEIERLTYIKAYEPLKLYLTNNKYSKHKIFEFLDMIQKTLLDEIYCMIDKLSTETWLMYLRRVYTLHMNSEYLRVLNILLVNNMNQLKPEGFIHELRVENNHILITDIDTMNNLFESVFEVSFKIIVLCSITTTMRLVGKGMVITGFDESSFYPIFANNKTIRKSLQYYDNYHIPFSKLALPVNIDIIENTSMEEKYDCFGLMPIKEPLYIRHDVNGYTWAMMHYAPCVFRLDDVFKLLDKYCESIEIIYNVTMQSIYYVIYALSKLTGATTIPLLYTFKIKDEKIHSSIDLSKEMNRVKFSFDLCNKGYLHFEKDNLINRMCSIDYNNYSGSKKKELIHEFIDAFCLLRGDDIKIYSEFMPFMYLTKSNNIIIDYTSFFYFLESLLKSGKEYYATLQGDRFNAYVRKKLGNLLSPKMFLYDKERVIINKNKEKAQIDVIVNTDDTIYLIECKAYEKKAQYLKGHPKEITNRISLINQAVKQAKRSCKIVGDYFDIKYDKKYKYEWIVCSADREFIFPLDKYGYLYDEIPKVCTVEDIIEFMIHTKV